MTVAVSWVGNGRQFTANIGTDTVTVIKYAGAGGTPSAAAADGSIEGSTALTVTVNKTGIAMFVAVPTALDFTTTEAGELIYVWGNFLASSLLATQAANGFGICLSSGTPTTSNYSLFSFFGSDNYTGGWKRMVLDPTKTRSGGAGTLTTSNITHIGVFADVGTTTARFDNLLLDACDVGTGLKVTGTSTLGLIEELLANEATNSYGVITALNDTESAVELSGQLILGDDTGVLATTITDENSKIFVAEPLYYNAAVVPAAPLTYSGISVVGNATGDTSVIIGQAVGADNGRNGITIVGNATYDVTFDRDDAAVEASDFLGTTFEDITGTINLDGVHDFNGNTMVNCGSLTAAPSSVINNLTSVTCGQLLVLGTMNDSLIINNTAATAIIAASATNISGCAFTSDGTGHALQVTFPSTGGSMTWGNTDSGYAATDGSTGNETIRVIGSPTPASVLVINVASGATTPTIKNDTVETVSVVASVPLTWTVIDKNNVPIVGAQVTAFLVSDDSSIIAATDTNGSGVVSLSYGGSTPVDIYYRVRKSSPGDTKYKLFSAFGTISTTGFSATVTLTVDPNNNS